MGAAKKLQPKMTSDEKWLADAIKEGRAVETSVSMKALGNPDIRLQQRVHRTADDGTIIHLDAMHVARFELMVRDKREVWPIVVFKDPKTGKLRVADGFHRHAGHRKAGADSIRAFVIEGTFRDALMYSTMCNQLAILNRTREDVKKAVFALLEDEEAFRWSTIRIANHVGNCTPPTVAKYRAEFCDLKKIARPTVVEASDGREFPAKMLVNGRPAITKDRQGGMSANFDGKHVYLGKDLLASEQKVSDFLEMKVERRSSLEAKSLHRKFLHISHWFTRSNLNNRLALGSVYHGHGVVWTSATLDRHSNGASSTDLHVAHASVRLARNLIDPTARAVVICYPEDAPPELLAAARADGVEYLTPEELVESLKGQGK